MEHTRLQEIQTLVNLGSKDMAACLGVDYEQYRRFYYGHTKITPAVERAALELEQFNTTFMSSIPERVDIQVRKDYPNGMVPGDYAECD